MGCRETDAARFWAKVDKTGDCWLWRGERHAKGYGVVERRGRRLKAHRYAYELDSGQPPGQRHIRHACLTWLCVRPSHLVVVDYESEDAAKRFWARVEKTDGCWLWTGATRGGGYGSFRVASGKISAHRLAMELVHGPVPAHLFVCHRCDNPLCVNPAHLFLGTNADNIADKVQKGRQSRGERHPQARLTVDAVREIRAAVKSGQSYADLARKWGITPPSVRLIALRRTWRHIE